MKPPLVLKTGQAPVYGDFPEPPPSARDSLTERLALAQRSH